MTQLHNHTMANYATHNGVTVRADRSIPADLLTHSGRLALLEYVSKNTDASKYYIDEYADGERGKVTYSLSLRKGTCDPASGMASFSLFDSIALIREQLRVSRATQKQVRDLITDNYARSAEHIEKLERASGQWRKQQRVPGQVKYTNDNYQLYIGEGYAVDVNITTKAESVRNIGRSYQPNELGAPDSTCDAPKYAEYNRNIDLREVFERYQTMTTAQLDALITEREERERKAEAERRAEYQRKEDERKAQEATTRAAVSTGSKRYVLVRKEYKDDSDIMTDYFSNTLDTAEIIAETDTPIRTTFAGGRMDIWRMLRAKGVHIDGLKWKHHGGMMSLQSKEYTGSGSYTAVVFMSREALERDSYIIAALAHKQQAAAAPATA